MKMASSSSVKLEFGVEMTCKNCEDTVRKALENAEGIKNVTVDQIGQSVVLETFLPSHEVKSIIEKTGKRAVVLGLGSGKGESLKGLGAAVSILQGNGVQGVARIIQVDEKNCVIEGTVDGLIPGMHQLKVHEFGDLTRNCESCGDVFKNPFSKTSKPAGDLGPVEADTEGRASFRLENGNIKVYDMIGRSMILHKLEKQKHSLSGRIACGIIARSSGLFENSKRICACDGVSLWDERDVPAAGGKRQKVNEKL